MLNSAGLKDKQYLLFRTYTISEPVLNNTSIWIPKSRSSLNESKMKPDYHSSTKFEWGEIYRWDHEALLNLEPFVISIKENVKSLPAYPPVSGDFINSCLSKNDPLCKSADKLRKIIAKLDINNQERESVEKIKEHIIQHLKYEYPPRTRNAEDVLENMCSDCAGYHAVFVTLLRMINIPAVMDFGARLPDCSPHVWAWWYDTEKKEWNFEDLNDLQKQLEPSDRVSFTLGTGLKGTSFPKEIQFLQNSLVWDWNYNLHSSIFKKKVRVDIKIEAKLLNG